MIMEYVLVRERSWCHPDAFGCFLLVVFVVVKLLD
jgi:hypothetical protein